MFNLKKVVEAVKTKAVNPEDRSIRPILYIRGGAAKGAVNAGNVMALNELGLFDTFRVVIGQSAGACVGAYALANQFEIGASVFYEDLASKDFIDLSRIQGSIMDIDYVMKVISFQSSPKCINREAIWKSGKFFYTICQTADDKLLTKHTKNKVLVQDANNSRINMHIRASISYPGLWGKTERIDGQDCRDCVINPLPIKEILKTLKEHKPTHLLILDNWPEKTTVPKYTLEEEIAVKTALIRNPVALEEIACNKEIIQEEMEYAGNISDVKIGIVYPEIAYARTLSIDSELARASVKEGQEVIKKLFVG